MNKRPESAIRSLQLGKSWLPEQSGSGLDRMYYGLVQSLPDVGVSVSGLVAGSDAVARDSGGVVRSFASDRASIVKRFRGSRRSIRETIAQQRPDLAAIHFAVYAYPGRSFLRKIPRVIHFHGPWALESRVEGKSSLNVRAKQAVEQAVYRDADRYIVLSDAFGAILRENYDVAADRIRIVPGGVDAKRFNTATSRQEAREQLGWPSDRPIVLSVRRLARRMGLENLVEAASLVKRLVPDVLFLMAGKGPLQAELEQRIRDTDCSDSVRLLGYVPDEHLPLAYRASSLTIAPTVSLEGFGLITIESLASGTPVLVTPTGGLPEVVSGLSSNLVLDGFSPMDIADRICGILKGSVEVPSEAACRDYATTNFDWPEIALKTRAVYDEVLG